MNTRRVIMAVASAGFALTLTTSSCLFVPKIEDQGYSTCASDADCVPGRACTFEICAPPDWLDAEYKQRQHLVVENPGTEAIEAGAAIPVEIGPNGVVPLQNFGGFGRFSSYRDAEWTLQPTFIDIFADRFVAYVPLAETLGPGEKASLVFIETTFEGEEATLSPRDDKSVFAQFFDFEPEAPPETDGGPGPTDAGPIAGDGGPIVPVDAGVAPPVAREFDGDDNFRIHGGPAVINTGVITVRDNQQLSSRVEFLPPFRATFVGRFNNTTCTRVFFGVRGASGVGYTAPSAEFSVGENLEGLFEIAPGAADFPNAISSPVSLDNIVRRYSIEIAGNQVRADIDGELFAQEDNLRPGFQPDVPLFLTLDVDGNNCSFDLEEIRVTKLGLPGPKVTADLPVEYVAFGDP